MIGGTETVIQPTPPGTTVTTTATVSPPVSQKTFDRVPVDITFALDTGGSWSCAFEKGERARILLGLWDEYGPFQPVEAGVPDEIITAGQKAQAAYWYAMKTRSLSETADAINLAETTVSIYSSQVRWNLSR